MARPKANTSGRTEMTEAQKDIQTLDCRTCKNWTGKFCTAVSCQDASRYEQIYPIQAWKELAIIGKWTLRDEGSKIVKHELATVIENEDWKLGCFMDWRQKSHAVECDFCHGSGEVGGGFHDLDGARQCSECFGSKIKYKGPTTPKPEIPPELREHMRRAWWDFLNNHNSVD